MIKISFHILLTAIKQIFFHFWSAFGLKINKKSY